MSRPLRDRGSVPIETAMLAPAILAFVLLVVAAGRVQSARATVEEAARDGARAASLARNDTDKQSAIAEAVKGALAERHLHCVQEPTWAEVKKPPLSTTVGFIGTVTIRVTCTVDLGDLMDVSKLNWDRKVTGEFTSVVDHYRGN